MPPPPPLSPPPATPLLLHHPNVSPSSSLRIQHSVSVRTTSHSSYFSISATCFTLHSLSSLQTQSHICTYLFTSLHTHTHTHVRLQNVQQQWRSGTTSAAGATAAAAAAAATPNRGSYSLHSFSLSFFSLLLYYYLCVHFWITLSLFPSFCNISTHFTRFVCLRHSSEYSQSQSPTNQ